MTNSSKMRSWGLKVPRKMGTLFLYRVMSHFLRYLKSGPGSLTCRGVDESNFCELGRLPRSIYDWHGFDFAFHRRRHTLPGTHMEVEPPPASLYRKRIFRTRDHAIDFHVSSRAILQFVTEVDLAFFGWRLNAWLPAFLESTSGTKRSVQLQFQWVLERFRHPRAQELGRLLPAGCSPLPGRAPGLIAEGAGDRRQR